MQSLISTQYADLDAPLRAILAPRYNVHSTEIDLQFEVSAFSGERIVVRVDNEQVEQFKVAEATALLASSHSAEKKDQVSDKLVIDLLATLEKMLEQQTRTSAEDASLIVGLLMRTTFWRTIVLAVQTEQESALPLRYWYADDEAGLRAAERGEREENEGRQDHPSDLSMFDPNNPNPFRR